MPSIATMAADSGEAVRVLFRAAAGPRIGYGHLVRATVLAQAMGAPAIVSVRGNEDARATARRLGCRTVDGSARALLRSIRPDLVLIDDPSGLAATAWCRAAQSAGVPVASVHDIGIGYCGADLTVDGSVTLPAGKPAGPALLGPRYAILAPRAKSVVSRDGGSLPEFRGVAPASHTATAGTAGQGAQTRQPRWGGTRDAPPGNSVLVALGGGPRDSVALALARAIRAACPNVAVRAAAGHTPNRRRPTVAGITWLEPQRGLADELAHASVAVVGGGVTLYEACREGTPAVAITVVRAQRPTICAFVSAGAALDGGAVSSLPPSVTVSLTGVPPLVARLMDDPALRRRIGIRGRALIDGCGAERVARALTALVRESRRSRRGGRT